MASHKLIESLGYYMLNGEYQATFPAVLVLAGMEVTCFLGAHMELCFEFVTKTVSITLMLWLQLDHACAAARLSFPPPPSRQGVGKRRQSGTADPN